MRKQKETEEQAIERRKRMYGCDGKCYCDSIWDEDLKCFVQNGCCGGIDTCEETRVGEATGTCLAVLVIMAMPVIFIGFIIIAFLGGR